MDIEIKMLLCRRDQSKILLKYYVNWYNIKCCGCNLYSMYFCLFYFNVIGFIYFNIKRKLKVFLQELSFFYVESKFSNWYCN